MKKLLVLLLISALAIFVFAGCAGIGTPATPAEGEGEGEVEGVTVDIDGAVEIGGKTYVSAGSHDITVTFPAPAEGSVGAVITDCAGDYSKQIAGDSVVLFPNEDKTVWTGSGSFGGDGLAEACCASYVGVYAGECDADICVEFPVIVDAAPPYASIVIETDDDCVCEDCDIIFSIDEDPVECADNVECCADDCSGLASWSIALFDTDPFGECCTIPCEEPVFTCSGTECPIECSTGCLEVADAGDTYYVIASLVDEVGNDVEYYATIDIDSACGIVVTEHPANVCINGTYQCTDWAAGGEADTNEDGYVIGSCENLTYESPLYNMFGAECVDAT